jgi:single-strand DNA-binding protein
MNYAIVTFTGYVATNPELRTTTTGKTVASFRVATTERRFDRPSGKYIEGATTFYTVTCWAWVAERAVKCLKTGDGVIVSGRLAEKSYTRRDGSGVTTYLEVEVDAIGPDLFKTDVEVQRRPRPDEAASADAAPAESTGVPAPAVARDPWARPLGQREEPAA